MVLTMKIQPKVSGRELRRTLKTQSETVEQGLVPAVRGLLANERLLIAKVEALEADRCPLCGTKKAFDIAQDDWLPCLCVTRVIAQEADEKIVDFVHLDFWGRLRWLIGR